MDWSASTGWWLATGALVVAELATGTFYLLMLALGAAAGALAAHAGAGLTGQIAAAALLGGGAVVAWHLRRSRQPVALPAALNPDVNLDIGGTVQVDHWQPDGSARVHYRGADWDARHAGTGLPTAGEHVIRAIEGTRLLLERAPR
ncbi:MAG: NfeD family protein [Aquabacterium sp.]|nr:NfeD family protein [Aquabacterium sp.]